MMTSFQKTFRKSGSHHAEFHSLQGVEVKIGERFRPPKKVTLPVGWQQRDPSVVLSVMYDFSLEKDVISKADALKASTKTEVQSSPEPHVESSSSDTPSGQNLVFSNVGSEILQPVVAPGLGHKKSDSFGGKGKNAFDLADFEGDTSTPFELVELQTINDMDELKNVLQPNIIRPATTVENPSNSHADTKLKASTSASATSISVSPPQSSLIDITGTNSCNKPSSVTKPSDVTTSTNANTRGALLVDFGDSRTSSSTPQVPAVNSDSVTTTSLSSTRLFPENRPISRGGVLPPIGQSVSLTGSQQLQGQTHSQILTHAGESRDSFQGGIYNFPKTPPLQGQQPNSIPRDARTQLRQSSPPSTVFSPREPESIEPQSPGVCGHYPSPLPPIGKLDQGQRTGKVSEDRSSLPDPWPVLEESEKAFVKNIASMGFPQARVSRAVQRLGMKDSEVMEFLLAVNELSEKKYPPDTVEVALAYNNNEKAKAAEFLELVKKYKDFGFKEDNILNCLQAANNDEEKALEYLIILGST